MNTKQTIISLVASYRWELHQMHVKSVFFNGDLRKEIYMQQPHGFIIVETSSLVSRLNNSLYGLKQAPRASYDKIDTYLLKNGFKWCISYLNLYVNNFGDEFFIVVLYVDDIIITSSQMESIHELKNNLKNQFEMADLDILHYFLGLQIWHMSDGIFFSHPKYATYLFSWFHMIHCNPSPTPLHTNVKLTIDCTTPLADDTLYR